MSDAYLIQKVSKPTRNVRLDQKSNIVDLVLVNDEKIISDIIHSAPIGASDHDTLYFQINMPKKKVKEERSKRFNLNKGKYKEMRENMSKTNWTPLNNLEVDEQWNYIENVVIENMNKYIPKTEAKGKQERKPCWMKNKVLRKIKKKYQAYKRYLITKEGQEYEKYIRKRNACTRAISKAKKKSMKKI